MKRIQSAVRENNRKMFYRSAGGTGISGQVLLKQRSEDEDQRTRWELARQEKEKGVF